jgi:3,4-dihydroxy 2-butanone 4-phosphate synthase/GTP cyclohydrolase II
MSETPFATIEDAISDFREGKFLIVTDDEDRENEGDLFIAAEKVTPEAINFMAKHARGLICVPMTAQRLNDLSLSPMTPDNTESQGTAFHISVDARFGATTGISAFDRAQTVKVLIDPKTKPSDLRRPGHIFPLRAREGGVLARAGHTEAAVDLARLAGLYPAAVLCEIMDDDGTMARLPRLVEFAREHGLKIVTIAELIRYRRQKEKLVRRVAECELPTMCGRFRLVGYESIVDNRAYVALVMGDIKPDEPTLVRMHSGCLTGDALLSLACDCGDQLRLALVKIAAEGKGVCVYIPHHEGRGIGLLNKIKAHALQDTGKDTVEANEALGFKADMRDYGLGAQVLGDLGVSKMKLMTNNPAKRVGLEAYGLEVVERVPLTSEPNEFNRRYLSTKKEKMGHLLEVEG